ncbi:MAG: dTDP-4-amino-4,6-dideoxygalactose transaminase [Saprospiraceae bacterium]
MKIDNNKMNKIPFNKPYLSGNELDYIALAVKDGKTSGNQLFSKKVHDFFNQNYSFKKSLFTTSCTDALEMSAILINICKGDEVIMPSYTFVSTANAFVLRGAKIVFADSYDNQPNINADNIEPLITSKTKAIVVVHYAGVACDMDKISALCKKYNLYLIEDAAQAIESYYKNKPLGSIGDISTFSFHETKNISCGEGGLLAINNDKFLERSEIIWEKGTNRSAFFRGEVNKYGWVDIGSSYLASDILAAYLYAQIENIDKIQKRRSKIWNIYSELFKEGEKNGWYDLPVIPAYATNNGHMFYIVCKSGLDRQNLLSHLKQNKIHAVFHYLALHKSDYYIGKHDGRILPNADKYTERLVRFPFFYELEHHQIISIYKAVSEFFKK